MVPAPPDLARDFCAGPDHAAGDALDERHPEGPNRMRKKAKSYWARSQVSYGSKRADSLLKG